MTFKRIAAVSFRPLVIVAMMLAHHSYTQSSPRRIDIVAKRFEFSPAEVTIRKGEPVVLAVTSNDVDHGLKFRELNLAVTVKKGHTGEIAFTPTQVGTYVGQCSVFCGSGHGGMKFTLRVTE